MKRGALLWVTVSLLGACSGRELEIGEDPPAAAAHSLESVCLTDGEFDFALTAEDLSAWDGAAARAVAYEPLEVGEGASARRPADVRGVVSGGRFVAACPKALRPNGAYPSAAVFIDVNGDGRCSPGDVGLSLQFYGWIAGFAKDGFTLPEAGAEDHAWRPVESLEGRIGSDSPSFCGAFFE